LVFKETDSLYRVSGVIFIAELNIDISILKDFNNYENTKEYLSKIID
jgi:hypothetical protein